MWSGARQPGKRTTFESGNRGMEKEDTLRVYLTNRVPQGGGDVSTRHFMRFDVSSNPRVLGLLASCATRKLRFLPP
jgi:hypothetical protein